jgi:prepilin-type N-terminal cleavage/methylation domain-containing protein
MTLIELVVALAITGMAVSAGYGTFAMLADRRDNAARNATAMLRESSKRASLVRWLEAARLTIEEDDIQFRGIDGGARSGVDVVPDDDIVFFTTAATPVARAGTIVHLYIDRRDDTPERGLVAELREWKGTHAERVELVPNAVALDGTYLSGLFGARQWLASWVSTSVLPAGARLAISAVPSDSLPALWRLPITVSIEGGR